jgi:hypothetical protein
MMKRTLIGLPIAMGLAHSALAQDAGRGMTMDDVQAQLSACVAYYSLEMECSEGGAAARFIRLLGRQSDAAAKASELSSADVAMRIELNLAMQRSLIEYSCANIARLRARREDECQRWVRAGGAN